MPDFAAYEMATMGNDPNYDPNYAQGNYVQAGNNGPANAATLQKGEYIDRDGQVKKRRGGKFALCLACCWCVTWPCHGPCCGGL